MKRIILLIALGFLIALAFTVPAFAGGWAVITLDQLPGQLIANEPVEIGFMVRQHGVRPMEGLAPTVHVQLPEFGKSFTFTAKEQGETGHYVATLTLPEAGEWQWSIEAFTGSQPMPPLVVSAASVTSEGSIQAAAPASMNVQWLAGILGAAAVLVGIVIAFRRKARWAIALALAGLVVGAGSIVSAAGQNTPESAPSVQREANTLLTDSSVSQADLGHQLFIAKGCMVCHSHRETNQVREFGVDIDPNLTDLTFSPDYLRLWLKSPLAVKSTATMPTLGLSDSEIEALIAFINDK